MGRKRKPGLRRGDDIQGPTAEQMAHGSFSVVDVTDKRNGGGSISIGKAYRRTPVIDTLSHLFSERELRALHHYRHHADIANRSLVRDSLAAHTIRAGNGSDGPTITVLNALQVVNDCERAVGTLLDILRAVVVDDVSLSQWAIAQAGGIDQPRERHGRVVVSIEPRRKALEIARLEIQMAAKRVEAELAA